MTLTLLIGAPLLIVLGSAFFPLFQTWIVACFSAVPAFERQQFSWKHYRPLARLLDPADFQFLRDRGCTEAQVKKLRKGRRRICRLCLRSLAQDFYRQHRDALNLARHHAHGDRDYLMAELNTMRLLFRRNLILVEVRLLCDATGRRRTPMGDLLRPLEMMQAQLRELELANANMCGGPSVFRNPDFVLSPSASMVDAASGQAAQALPALALVRRD